MSLQQIYDTSANAGFIQRATASILKAALSIVGEDWDTAGFSASKAGKRHAVGVEVLRGNTQTLASLIKAVAANCGEVADPATLTDNQLDTATAAVWNDVAGVMFDE